MPQNQINTKELQELRQEALMRLEWPLFLNQVSHLASLEATRRELKELSPWNMRLPKEEWFQLTAEAINLNTASQFYQWESFESEEALLVLKRQGVLLGSHLYAIFLSLKNAKYYHGRMKDDRFFSEKFPKHADFIDSFQIPWDLYEIIEKSIHKEGHVLPKASDLLGTLHGKLKHTKNKISEILERSLRGASWKSCLQEEMWVFQEGRYVLPVKMEHKNTIPGVVRSISQSGATVFLEPEFLMSHHKELERLQSEIEIEEHRILIQLSNHCFEYHDAILTNIQTLVLCDHVAVRCRFAMRWDSAAPVFQTSENLKFDFTGAKHPLFLFEQKSVVPNDLYLGQTKTKEKPCIWMLSGPNAGGKTVILKTVGIFYLLALSGFYVTAKRAEMFAFEDIFVELGDRQNREENLSTFSGHLKQIQKICHCANKETLILLDEGFVGTDPVQGVALAQGALEFLAERRSTTLMTTHFSSLKVLGFDDPRFLNASMEFEQKNLQPTYKLLNEIPGQSYAIELAQRMGLPSEILRRSRNLFGKDAFRLENLLHDLQRRKSELQQEQKNFRDSSVKLEQELQELSADHKQFIVERENLIQTFRRRLEKRLNSFENKLETRERQFEKQLKRNLTEKIQQVTIVSQDTENSAVIENSKKSAKQESETQVFKNKVNEKIKTPEPRPLPLKPKQRTKQMLLFEASEELEILRQELDDQHRSLRSASDKMLKANQSLNNLEKKKQNLRDEKKKHVTQTDWKKGMRVRITNIPSVGTITKEPDSKGFVECAFGLIKKKCHISELTEFESK